MNSTEVFRADANKVQIDMLIANIRNGLALAEEESKTNKQLD